MRRHPTSGLLILLAPVWGLVSACGAGDVGGQSAPGDIRPFSAQTTARCEVGAGIEEGRYDHAHHIGDSLTRNECMAEAWKVLDNQLACKSQIPEGMVVYRTIRWNDQVIDELPCRTCEVGGGATEGALDVIQHVEDFVSLERCLILAAPFWVNDYCCGADIPGRGPLTYRFTLWRSKVIDHQTCAQ